MTDEKKPLRAKFQARFLPMIEPFMATQDIRYYLNGFLIERAERGGVYIVASNGYVMAAVHDAEGVLEGTDRVIIRRDAGLIQASKRKHSMLPHVVLENDRVTIANDFGMQGTDFETYVMPGNFRLEGNFPEWRRVLPDFSKLVPGIRSATMDSRYMAIFQGISRHLGTSYIRFWQNGGVDANGDIEGTRGAAIMVQHLAVPEFVAAIMPVKDTEIARQQAKRQLGIFSA